MRCESMALTLTTDDCVHLWGAGHCAGCRIGARIAMERRLARAHTTALLAMPPEQASIYAAGMWMFRKSAAAKAAWARKRAANLTADGPTRTGRAMLGALEQLADGEVV